MQTFYRGYLARLTENYRILCDTSARRIQRAAREWLQYQDFLLAVGPSEPSSASKEVIEQNEVGGGVWEEWLRAAENPTPRSPEVDEPVISNEPLIPLPSPSELAPTPRDEESMDATFEFEVPATAAQEKEEAALEEKPVKESGKRRGATPRGGGRLARLDARRKTTLTPRGSENPTQEGATPRGSPTSRTPKASPKNAGEKENQQPADAKPVQVENQPTQDIKPALSARAPAGKLCGRRVLAVQGNLCTLSLFDNDGDVRVEAAMRKDGTMLRGQTSIPNGKDAEPWAIWACIEVNIEPEILSVIYTEQD